MLFSWIRNLSRSAGALAATLALIGPAAAEGPTLDQLIAEALTSNPSVAAIRERIAAAQEMIAPAGAAPDPMVEVMYTEAAMSGFPTISLGDEPMSMLGAEFRQPLVRRAKRTAAQDAARATAQVQQQGLEALLRELVRDIRVLYGRLYALDRQVATFPAANELLDVLRETTAARYSASQASQEELLKVQLQRTRLAETVADVQADRAVMVAMLGRLLNRPEPLDLPPIGELPAAALPWESIEDAAIAASARLAVRRAEIAAAESRVHAAQQDVKADTFVAGGASYRGSIDPVITVRFGWELPLHKKARQLPMIRAAEREVEMSRQELRATEAEVREAVRGAQRRREQAEDQIRRYEEGLIPQTQAALGAARSEYLSGRGDFSTVIEDFNLWLDARVELARREADRFVAVAELQALVAPAPEVQQ